MRSTIIIIGSLMLLSACTMPWTSQAPTAQKPIEYTTVQSESPAAKYCTAHHGIVSIEKNPAIPTMDLIYCTIGSEKIDAWKYMDIQTAATGVVTGTGTPRE